MRKNLIGRNGEKLTNATALFDRFGYQKTGYNFNKDTPYSVLLRDVRDEHGNPVIGHCWIPITTEFKNVNVNKGDRVSFDTAIEEYAKSAGTDYSLAYINNINVIESNPDTDLTVKDVCYFRFQVKESSEGWTSIRGSKCLLVHDDTAEIRESFTINAGDTIEFELSKIKEKGTFEYNWRTVENGVWSRNAYFDPNSFGQMMMIYHKYKIVIPDPIYFVLKDFYNKVKLSDAGIELPYKNASVFYIGSIPANEYTLVSIDERDNKIEDMTQIKELVSTSMTLDHILYNIPIDDLNNIFTNMMGDHDLFKFFSDTNDKRCGNRNILVQKAKKQYNKLSLSEKRKFLRLVTDYRFANDIIPVALNKEINKFDMMNANIRPTAVEMDSSAFYNGYMFRHDGYGNVIIDKTELRIRMHICNMFYKILNNLTCKDFERIMNTVFNNGIEPFTISGDEFQKNRSYLLAKLSSRFFFSPNENKAKFISVLMEKAIST